MCNKFQARQGDVFIMACDSVDDAKYKRVKRDNGGVVLAYGEVTGHSHQIRDRNVCLLRAEGVSDAVLTVGRDFAALLHEEHAAIQIPRGEHLIRIQKEFDWVSESARQVID